MSSWVKWMFLMFYVQIALGGLCLADELVMENGRKLEGNITRFENNEVTFDTGTGEFVINIKKISAIRTDSRDVKMRLLVAELQDKINASKGSQKAPRQTANKKISGKKVDLYILEGCPWCAKMEQFLTQKGIRYNRYDVRRDSIAKRRMRAKGGNGVPFTVINNDQVVSGYDPDGVMDALAR